MFGKLKHVDHFRPRTQPAQAIYDAFSEESKKRDGRNFDESHEAEKKAVHIAAVKMAKELNLREPTLEDINHAERYASGHTDYGACWAYKVTDIMSRK